MSASDRTHLLRALPSIDQVLEDPAHQGALAGHPRALQLSAARLAVDQARSRLLEGDLRPFGAHDVERAVRSLTTPMLRRVLNATGVILHTNLGRAPLARRAVDRVVEVASGYCNLEYDLDEGERGSRFEPVQQLLADLTGAESAMAVNNNAAAVLLALASLASGREVIVSRGELVEIGGGFRIPEVMAQSGATLVEVGTTNRTNLGDYERAITERTAVILKVHKSNFAVVGFTCEVTTGQLAALGRARGVPVFEDLGSGCLVSLAADGLTAEPTAHGAVAAGADLVCFSGDKLLGGPQAGILVGRRALIQKLAAHPLHRAVRVDKMTVAALEATLELYREGRLGEVPSHRMLTQRAEALASRAARLCELLAARGVTSTVEPTIAQVGGGAMPLASPGSFACALSGGRALELQARLRSAQPPVVARVAGEKLLLDVRCLQDDDLAALAAAVGSVA